MFSVNLSEIEPNKYRLSTNIIRSNTRIAKAGMLLDAKLIKCLQDYQIDVIYVSESKHDVFNIEDFIDTDTYNKVRAALKDCSKIDALIAACKQLTTCIMNSSLLNAPVVRMTAKKSKTDCLIDHCIGTACYAGSIACLSGMSQSDVIKYVTAGLLHDIGKLAVPDQILFSPYKLTPEEVEIIRKHPQQGYDILQTYAWVSDDIRIGVLQHHENFDGTGYPSKLKGEEICDIARVLHVADVYDALIRQRAYKPGWQPREAYDYMLQNSGTLFDPKYVNVFKNNVPIYEVGSLVRLSDASLAVVLRNIQNYTLKPIVISLAGNNPIDISTTDMTVDALVNV